VPDGEPAGHADSWGIGWFDDAGRVSLLRQTGWAEESAFYVFAAEAAARPANALSGPAAVLLGHLRKASRGAVTSENAHPVRFDFPRRPGDDRPGWDTLLVAHNGTVRDPLLSTLRADLREEKIAEAEADSDTVVLAAWLARRVAKNATDAADLFDALVAALRELLARVPGVVSPGPAREAYSALNLLVAHGSGDLFALRQFSHDGDYYTLFSRPGRPGEGASFLVASEPTDDESGWEPVPPGELVCFASDKTTRTARVDGGG
jgi:glutamine amidotransferase